MNSWRREKFPKATYDKGHLLSRVARHKLTFTVDMNMLIINDRKRNSEEVKSSRWPHWLDKKKGLAVKRRRIGKRGMAAFGADSKIFKLATRS
jgi:hypothetical protein